MIYIVRLHHLSRQLHDEEVLLVGAASRCQRRERIAAMRLLGLGELTGDEVQRGVPVGLDEFRLRIANSELRITVPAIACVVPIC